MELAPGLRVVLAPNPGPDDRARARTSICSATRDAVQLDAAPLDDENRRRLAAEASTVARLRADAHPSRPRRRRARPRASSDRGASQPRRLHASAAGRWRPRRCSTTATRSRGPAAGCVVVHTPGHESGHCCLYEPERRWLFTGDTVLSTGTTIIAPPDGDMRAYLASLAPAARARRRGHLSRARAAGRASRTSCSTSTSRTGSLRERQIVDALRDGPAGRSPALVPRIYVGLHPGLVVGRGAHGAGAPDEARARRAGRGRGRRPLTGWP